MSKVLLIQTRIDALEKEIDRLEDQGGRTNILDLEKELDELRVELAYAKKQEAEVSEPPSG